jgi:hypothetical protein
MRVPPIRVSPIRASAVRLPLIRVRRARISLGPGDNSPESTHHTPVLPPRTGPACDMRFFLRLGSICLAAVALPVSFAGARAQSAADIQRDLNRRSPGCSLYAYQEYFRGQIPGMKPPVTIAAYTLEGCGGGNNYARTVGAFYEAHGEVQQFTPPTPPVPGPDVGDRDAVTVRGNRITVRYKDYAANDPRCCPSLKRSARYILRHGAIVAAR